MQYPQVQVPASVAVFGLNVNSERVASLVRKVLILSGIAALFIVLEGVLSMVWYKGENIYGALASIIISLLLPGIGYIGARNSDASSMCIFCGCSLFCAVYSTVVLIALLTLLPVVERAVNSCDTTNNVTSGESNITCSDVENLQGVDFAWVYVVVSVSGGVSLILHCCSWWYGKELYSSLKLGEIVHVIPVPVPSYGQQHPQYPYSGHGQPVQATVVGHSPSTAGVGGQGGQPMKVESKV